MPDESMTAVGVRHVIHATGKTGGKVECSWDVEANKEG